MKVLLVNRFFGGTQVPTGRMAGDVARLLADAGHQVVALASSSAYEGAAQAQEEDGRREVGVETVRVPDWMPRALAWLWFTWKVRERIPQMDWDVCVLMTDPPLLPLLAARAACDEWRVTSDEFTDTEQQPKDRNTERPKRPAKRRVAVWLMDLYPEALAASGRIGARSPVYRWHFRRRQRALGVCDLLICLGEAQKERLGPELTEHVRTAVVPPWDDRGNIAPATESSLRNMALYAGNLGEAHGFEEILAAARHLPPDWTIRFAARGAKLGALLSKLRSDEWRVTGDESGSASAFAAANDSGVTSGSLKLTDLKFKTAGAVVHVSGYVSEEETPRLLASARVHLITMSPGWEGIVVPSKLYGCLRTGRPVLFIGPEDADTAREIRAHGWGAVLPSGANGEAVASTILELAEWPTKPASPQAGAEEVAELIGALAMHQRG